MLRLRKSKDNELKFCKKIGKDIHQFNFQKFMKHIIEEVRADQDDEDDESMEDEVEEDDAGVVGPSNHDREKESASLNTEEVQERKERAAARDAPA